VMLECEHSRDPHAVIKELSAAFEGVMRAEFEDAGLLPRTDVAGHA